jgi:predicted aconitase with swiveling domain
MAPEVDMVFGARRISRGKASGPALLSPEPVGFLGGVDPKSGEVIEKNHPLVGKNVAGRVLVFPHGKGSTVGSYVMLQLAKNGKAPAAIINISAEPIIAVGAIISGIPMVDRPGLDVFSIIKEGMMVEVDGNEGRIRIMGNERKKEKKDLTR